MDYDGTEGTIETVIDSPEERAAWGVAESGLMLRTDREGLVFLPVGACDWGSVLLLNRAATSH